MSDVSHEVKIALMAATIVRLESEQAAQDKRITDMEDERNKGLKWGIIALGGMVISMLAWAATYLKDHLK